MPTEHSKHTHCFATVYLAELDYMKERRDKMDIPSDTVVTEIERVRELKQTERAVSESETLHLSVTSAKTGLVGLALSGGGVRSATFNLGLLQSLAKNKVLQYCDYLSTVSGGGYIGSCLSSLLADNKDYSTKKEAFPFREIDSKTLGERPEVNHLRATKNYLGLSGGAFSLDIWHMIGTMLSGLFLMSIIPLALILSFVLLLYFIPVFETAFLGFAWYQVALGVVITLVLSLFIWMVLIHFRLILIGFNESSYIRHNKRIARRAAIASLLVVSTLVVGIIYWLAWAYSGQHTVFIYILGSSLLVIILGLLSTSNNKFQKTLIKVIMSLALTVCVCVVFSWLLSLGYTSVRLPFQSVLKQIENSDQKLIQSKYLKDNLFLFNSLPTENNQESWFNNFRDWMRDEIEETTEEEINNALEIIEKDAMFLLKIRQLIQSDRLTQVIKKFDERTFELDEIRSSLREEYGKERIAGLIEVMKLVQEKTLSINLDIAKLIGIAIIILLLVGMLININRNSLHYFYRDRLSKTYMIKWGQEKIEQNSSMLLKDIHQCCNGPYHLINTTLNVPHSQNSSLSGRGADFFIFSKYYCGAESTGYRTTTSYNQGKTKVATAMAISGAAASPEMGTSTNPIMVILMTLLNVRLNLWMPNPNRENPPKFTFWPKYLLKELFRKGTENDALINLSDGGHHENLGIYPLLKRRCRVIIASDAEADPDFKMTAFANLQRKARIDLGINITIDLTDLRPELENNRYTQAHFVEGTIHYPDDEPGTLLYIKTTLTGEEPEDLLAYRRVHSSFPDETTADQFFNEDQFESYRKLGELSGDTVFSKEKELEKVLLSSKNK